MNISRMSCGRTIANVRNGNQVARVYFPDPDDLDEDVAITYNYSLGVLVSRNRIRIGSYRDLRWIDSEEFPELPWNTTP